METIKLVGDYKQWVVSQTQLSKMLNISQPRINQLIDEQIVFRDDGSKNGAVFLIDSLRNYYSSKNAAKDNDGTANFWKERALHERAKRQLSELKLAVQQGELYEASTIEFALTETITNFRNKLSGIPAKMAMQLQGKTAAQINQLLTEEIENDLNELADELEGGAFLNEDETSLTEEDSGGDTSDAEN